MKKTSVLLLTFSFIAISAFVYLSSCTKDNSSPSTNTNCDPVCDVRGSYSGTFTNQGGQTGIHAYILREDNFVTSADKLTSAPTAFGSYTNTCDSIKIREWNSINNSYYYFAGKFSNNRTTITGTYKNLTTPSETGPFTLTKQ
jgi:hypothetical protein